VEQACVTFVTFYERIPSGLAQQTTCDVAASKSIE
jgi:hypothetical protein